MSQNKIKYDLDCEKIQLNYHEDKLNLYGENIQM